MFCYKDKTKTKIELSQKFKRVLNSSKENLVIIVSKAAERSNSVRMHILLLSIAVRRSLAILSRAVSVLWLDL